jgi:hypothetical protein
MILKAFLTGFFIACAIGAASAAEPAGPASDYKMDQRFTEKSPDGAITIEQYMKETDSDVLWQFWIRRGASMTLLNAEPANYPAGFRFTNDLQWLVRMQKTGSGESTLYLYKSGPKGFEATTGEPIGDLAWNYLKKRPEYRKVEEPTFHISTDLLKGTEESYRWLGVNWAENRYLVLTLSGDVDANSKHHQLRSVHGWRCRYDLQEGTFDVPADFAKHNAKALVPE